MPESPALTRSLLAFIDASPTPFHAVAEARRRLAGHSFSPLDEREPWRLESGGRHVVVRHDSSLVAFALGARRASSWSGPTRTAPTCASSRAPS